jgi:type II secretory pathway pseudopilin PulG
LKPHLKFSQKRHFSLLEVMIALLLITASLPLLLTTFVYAAVDQSETVKKMQQEKSAFYFLTTILTDLHTGVIPLSQLDARDHFPITDKETQATGTYKFDKIKKGDQELWQVMIEINQAKFPFEFIVLRNTPLDAPPEGETPET